MTEKATFHGSKAHFVLVYFCHACNKKKENSNTVKHAVFLAMTFMMMRADSSIKDANVV